MMSVSREVRGWVIVLGWVLLVGCGPGRSGPGDPECGNGVIETAER